MSDFNAYKPTISPPDPDYPTKWNGAMDDLDEIFNDAAVFAGTLSVAGDVALNGGSLAGTFTGDPEFSGSPEFSGTAIHTGPLSMEGPTASDLTIMWPTANARMQGIGSFGIALDSDNNSVSEYFQITTNTADPFSGGTVLLRLLETGRLLLNQTADTGESLQLTGSAKITSDVLVGGALGVTGKVSTPLSATGGAGLIIPHGAAPSAPVNGDIWSTTTTLNFRLNGVTKSITLT